VLQAGQSAVTLEGGDITFACPGKFSVKGGKHIFDQRANAAAALESLPMRLTTVIDGKTDLVQQTDSAEQTHTAHQTDAARRTQYDEQIVYKDTHGDAIADIPFRIANKADDAQRLVHKTPADGQLDRLVTPSAQPIEYALRYAEFKIKK
jgi:type VI secretion system secreted protein VgrG